MASRLREQGDELRAQLDLAGEKEHQRAEEQQQLADGGRDEGHHRQDHTGHGRTRRLRAIAEQRVFQLAQRRERLVEHGEPLLDDAADFRSASDPLVHRTGHRGHGDASAPSANVTRSRAVIHGEIPRRLAALTTGPSVRATMAAAKIGSRMARPK